MGNRDCDAHKVKVVNLGLTRFYDAMIDQKVEVVQVDWHPPVKQTKEMQDLLDMFM